MTTEQLFQSAEYRAFYAACVSGYQEATGWGGLRDWLRDHDCPEVVVQEADPVSRIGVYDIDRFIGIGSGIGSGSGIGIGRGRGSGIGIGIGRGRGSGIGIGIGRGRGSGIGIGIGSGSGIGIGRGRGSGIGIGIGRGRGSGIGIGSGIGSGSGIGIGRGRGSGSGKPFEARQMETGKCYLIHCGDWHTFVGRVVKQIGPQTYLLESVSKVTETNNGDCWHDLAAGDAKLRKAASYAHYKTHCVVPLTIAAFEWIGKLPQEN